MGVGVGVGVGMDGVDNESSGHGGITFLGRSQRELLGSKTVPGPHMKLKIVCFPFRLKSTHLHRMLNHFLLGLIPHIDYGVEHHL